MNEITILIEQVKDFLIKEGIDTERVIVYNQFYTRTKELSLSEEQFYKQILSKASKGINIREIEEAKNLQRDQDKKMDEALKEKEDEINNAPKFIERLINIAFDDGILERNELKKILERARSLSQDVNAICLKINTKLDDEKYKSFPSAEFDAKNLMDTLVSTDWYAPNKYRLVAQIPQTLSKPFPRMVLSVSLILILLGSGAATYFLWYKPHLTEKNLPLIYSFADNLFLRSDPSISGNSNIIEKLPYGSELKIIDTLTDWYKVQNNKKVGYVATQYVLNKNDFIQMNAIFFDNISREATESSLARKALLDYFKNRGYIGKMEDMLEIELFGSKQNKDVWQLKTKPKTSATNSVYFKKLFNKDADFPEFGCIINNSNSYERKFLLFTFNENGKSTLIDESVAPFDAFIKDIKRISNNGKNLFNVTYTDN